MKYILLIAMIIIMISCADCPTPISSPEVKVKPPQIDPFEISDTSDDCLTDEEIPTAWLLMQLPKNADAVDQ